MQRLRTERGVAFSTLVLIAALLVVGVVSSTIRRHLVQTAPTWIIVRLGLRGSRWTRWAAFPCLVFSLALMTLVWMFLLGWTRVISGTFSPVEVTMPLVVGAACASGLLAAARLRSGVPLVHGVVASVASAGLQVLAFVVSFGPGIVHD